MTKDILYIADVFGVSNNMKPLLDRLSEERAVVVSLYNKFGKNTLLRPFKNRKAPAFTADHKLRQEITEQIKMWCAYYRPRVIVTADPATLFLCDEQPDVNVDWLILDNLRGGVYSFCGIPLIVTYPCTAWYREVRERDIAKANEGFSNKEDFDNAHEENGDSDETEEEKEDSNTSDEDHVFYAPIIVKVAVGKFTLTHDWRKAIRIADQSEPYTPSTDELAAYGIDTRTRVGPYVTTAELAARLRGEHK